MRTQRLAIPALLLLILVSCKSSNVSSSSTEVYEENLSVLRPDLTLTPEAEDSGVPEKAENPGSESFSGSLKTELDTVNKMMVAKNMEGYYVDGYTIQLYTGNDRDKADETKDLAQQIDPLLNPVISYYQPTYKVRVGQYTNRLEAHSVYETLKEYFPRALLLPERIKINYE